MRSRTLLRSAVAVFAVGSGLCWSAEQKQDQSEARVYGTVFKAAVKPRQPKPGGTTPFMPRDVYERFWQEEVGVSLTNLAEIERLAEALSDALKPIDARIAEIINAAKEQRKQTGKVPPMPAELKELGEKRVNIILDHRFALREVIGSEAFFGVDRAVHAWRARSAKAPR
jgi:hypothetical protein